MTKNTVHRYAQWGMKTHWWVQKLHSCTGNKWVSLMVSLVFPIRQPKYKNVFRTANRTSLHILLIVSWCFACFEHFLGEVCPSCDDLRTGCHTLESRGKHTSKLCKTGNHSQLCCTRPPLSLSDTVRDADNEGTVWGTHRWRGFWQPESEIYFK